MGQNSLLLSIIMPDRAASILRNVILLLLALGGLWWSRQRGYLLAHSLSELFSIAIAGGIFMVAWNSRRFSTSGYFLFVGLAYLFVAALDILHTLAYTGMGVFPGHGTDLPTQLWIAARSVEAISLLLAALLLRRKLHPYLVFGLYIIATILLVQSILAWHIFPTCFIEGSGLTPFKIISEYVICVILVAAMVLLWRQRVHFHRQVLLLLLASLTATIGSELCFTLYRDPYGPWNFAGHYLKIVSFYLVYKAIIETALTRPYSLLFRDLEQAKAAAEAANQAKDRFLAILSHELRNPLNPILIAVSAMQQDAMTPSAMGSDLQLIRRNIELEARLIDDLLDMTRISKGKLELTLQDVDAHALLQQVIETCAPELPAKDLSLSVDLRAERHYVSADAPRLQQVFWNLLRNAVKFTPSGGSITIRTANTPRTSPAGAGQSALVIEFSDTGIGIDPATLPRIFRAFEQGGHAITRQFGGLGLGLVIAKTLLEMHGGSIGAASPGIGHGATFTAQLPALDAAPIRPAPSTPASQPAAPVAARGLSILLVEDHQDTSRLMARLLTNLEHRVQVASTYCSALQVAHDQAFDLVISDIGLPDGNGLDLMRQLKEQYGLKGICLSGYGMERDVRHAREAGFLEHLTKPIDFQELQAAIERFAATTPQETSP